MRREIGLCRQEGMKTVESIKLSDVLKFVAKPKYILGTTYTLSLAFFESVVFPFIDRSNLKSCLILCDMLGYQRALEESSALMGAAQDYMVVPAPVEGCFHPKVWLLIGEREVLLLTGSGNLTQAGFMTNAEYFDAIHFTQEHPVNSEMLQSICSFLKGLADMWPSEDSTQLLAVETLTRMEEIIRSLPTAADDQQGPRFIHSFQGPLLDRMPAVAGTGELYVAAPFFGKSLEGLGSLVNRYKPAKLYLFPGVHNGEATDIPLKDVARTYRSAKTARISVPGKAGAFAHLKLYGVTGDEGPGWIFCTSANCTTAAWKGPNVEAGLLRPVQRSVFSDYFVPDKASLPEGSFQYKSSDSATGALCCWASDTGGGLDLAVAVGSRKYLPLKDVTLTVTAGSRLGTCQKTVLFQDAAFIHLPWIVFEGWHRPRKMAVCLQIKAKNAHGKEIHGGCLVENRALLTADPTYRSAWRGALALLDAEGAPELADIAAIFSLADDLLDGTLFRSPQANPGGNQVPGPPEKPDQPPAIAVWPPQPDLNMRDLERQIGRTTAGHLQWLQRIMQTFLKPEASSDVVSPHVDYIDTSDHEEAKGQEQSKRGKDEEERARSLAERMWDYAKGDFEDLRSRLHDLCPIEQQARHLWLAAIFTFLPTLAVLRSARRMTPDLDYGETVQYLCEIFIRMMLDIRKQDEDFCCPKGFRYKSETFPALADDLRANFKVKLHPDLTNVMLALIVDWKLRTKEGSYALMWPRLVKQVCEKEYVANEDNRVACRRIWQRYISDVTEKKTDEEFCRTFDELCAFRQE